MRVSLSTVVRRIERLALEVVPSLADARAAGFREARRMSPEQLDSQVWLIYEKRLGPLEDHATLESLRKAMDQVPHPWPSKDRVLPYWQRARWFHDHAAHGEPVLLTKEPDSRLPERPCGLGMVFQCPCVHSDSGNRTGGCVDTYENFVPPRLRTQTPRHAG